MNPIHPQPEVRRWTHPIENKQKTAPCEAIQAILCALNRQSQVLCAVKAELDEIHALLQRCCDCDDDDDCDRDDDCDCSHDDDDCDRDDHGCDCDRDCGRDDHDCDCD